ncbi:hypothetical protein Phou_015400 [Phytohabitans houttuyneae]|uniref:ATP-dependent helicase C-terminal domain-containing protein n=1 Tax=Phytohabitans houttuyneae TaxID=1076126 RepID=A0A6V8K195_9ACTN|nr:hypothetical protein Phou_015400 [Phytohabitans houttuyneae]
MRALVRSIADEHNVVVLVPSKRQAEVWAPEANLTVSKADDITAAVARLTRGRVGLVVIINRYDGIDLPDEACRLLVIDSLPFAYNGLERREAVALRDSDAMVTRQLQRLEQGMGRGVRSRDDRCVVLLLGEQLIQLLSHPAYSDRLSGATHAQLDVSRVVASRLEGKTAEELRPVIAQVIGNDVGFRKLTRQKLTGVTYSPASVSETAAHLRSAYNHAVAGRPREAAGQAQTAVEAARNDRDAALAGWLGETYATYLHAVDPLAAQQALTDAGRLNNAVLKPRAGVEYNRITPPSYQAQQAVDYLTARYSTGQELTLGLAVVLADIDWDATRTPEAEASLADLGRHLGFTAQMPERDFKIGSDVLWSVGSHTYWVIEAKTGSKTAAIGKHDINQLAGSTNWCRTEYGTDATVVPIIVHQSHIISREGTPPPSARVINVQKLKGLKAAVYQFMRAVADGDRYRTPAEVEKQLTEFKLNTTGFIEAFTQLGYREPLSP